MFRNLSLVLATTCLAACGGANPSADPEISHPITGACADGKVSALGVRTVKSLTEVQLKQTLSDLLQADLSHTTWPRFGATVDSFPNPFNSLVSAWLHEGNERAERMLAEPRLQIAQLVDEYFMPECDTAQACVDYLIDDFGYRALRRPLNAHEAQAVAELFEQMPVEEATLAAAKLLLGSSDFFLRSERGLPVADVRETGYPLADGTFIPANEQALAGLGDDVYVLTPFELATQLSYMYTGSTPDKALLNAARAGKLETEQGVQEQIDGLLATDKAKFYLGQFVTHWLRLTHFGTETTSALEGNLRAAMEQEITQFYSHIALNDAAPYTTLFTADYTFANGPLARHYGLDDDGLDDGLAMQWRRYEGLEGRGGLLASGAFMAGHAHGDRSAPVVRAALVHERLLCNDLWSDHTGVQTELRLAHNAAMELAASTPLTTRAYYETLTEHDGVCTICHDEQLNGLFGMEDFDAFGLLRDHQAVEGPSGTVELPINTAGTFTIAAGSDNPKTISFSGTKDLSERIAAEGAAKACLIQYQFRYAFDRPANPRRHYWREEPVLSPAEERGYACAVEQLEQTLDNNGGRLLPVLRKLGTLDIVRYRH